MMEPSAHADVITLEKLSRLVEPARKAKISYRAAMAPGKRNNCKAMPRGMPTYRYRMKSACWPRPSDGARIKAPEKVTARTKYTHQSRGFSFRVRFGRRCFKSMVCWNSIEGPNGA